MAEKIYVFIDSQNLNLSIQRQGWKLDFGRFRKYLSDKYKAEKTFLFIGYLHGNESLYTSLQKQGFILVLKPTLLLPNKKVKGNVDAELVLHSMIEFANYKKAIIVSNDGDFHCLIKYLKEKGKLLKLLIPDKHRYSSLLKEFGSNMDYMNNLRQKLEYKKERH